MKMLADSHFAQALSPVTPLPKGPVLMLPSGDVGVQDEGGLFFVNHLWVVAVALSDNVVLVSRDRTERYVATRLLHEMMGYLVACGCELILLDFRCPLAWRTTGSFESIRGMWVAHFFEEADRLLFKVPLPLSSDPKVVLPLASLAADATMFWREAASVADALFADEGFPHQSLRLLLTRIAMTWERRWNEALEQASAKSLAADEFNWLPRCDQAWADLVRTNLEPHGYRMKAESIARLL